MGKALGLNEIQEAVRRKYAEVSCTAAGKFKYPTGKEGALNLGYDMSVIAAVPDDLLESFCGVGNPFTLGPLHPGDVVLDIGCGAGFDLVNAGLLAGPAGKVYGIDLTQEMIDKARVTIRRAGLTNGEVVLAGSDHIPYSDRTFDVVISNGVLNLSPLKEKSFQEIYRVLKQGGRFQFADIVLKEDLPDKVAGSLKAWSE
jgi:arsenite methyltransferase